jgi:hypothetical protein
MGVPLGGSRGLGSPPGGLWGAWGCKVHYVPKNRIIRSNLTNTVIYAINTIQRIIRLHRMTHPWYIYTVYDRIFGDFPAKNTVHVWFWPTLDISVRHSRCALAQPFLLKPDIRNCRPARVGPRSCVPPAHPEPLHPPSATLATTLTMHDQLRELQVCYVVCAFGQCCSCMCITFVDDYPDVCRRARLAHLLALQLQLVMLEYVSIMWTVRSDWNSYVYLLLLGM